MRQVCFLPFFSCRYKLIGLEIRVEKGRKALLEGVTSQRRGSRNQFVNKDCAIGNQPLAQCFVANGFSAVIGVPTLAAGREARLSRIFKVLSARLVICFSCLCVSHPIHLLRRSKDIGPLDSTDRKSGVQGKR